MVGFSKRLPELSLRVELKAAAVAAIEKSSARVVRNDWFLVLLLLRPPRFSWGEGERGLP